MQFLVPGWEFDPKRPCLEGRGISPALTEPDILKDVEQQIQRVASAPAGTLVPVLRNPAKE